MGYAKIEYYVVENHRYNNELFKYCEDGPYGVHEAMAIRDLKNSEVKTDDCLFTAEARG